MGSICSKIPFDGRDGKPKKKSMRSSMADKLNEDDKRYFLDLKKRRASSIHGLDLTGLDNFDNDSDSGYGTDSDMS